MSPQARFCQHMREYFEDRSISIIEIGTASGLWTEHVLRNYPNVKILYSIDPYLHFPGEKYEGGRFQDWHDKIFAVSRKRLKGYDNLARYICTSDEAVKSFKADGITVDVVYIDGNHNEKYITSDVENYYPLVELGGLFAGHDYNLPQVKKVVNDRFGLDRVNVFREERIWWIKKDTHL